VSLPPSSPSAPLVNASRFRAAHQHEWEALDELLKRMEKRGVRVLNDEAILALPRLYRSALSSLSVARETSLDRALILYLEQLCTRAYFQIYGVPVSAGRQLVEFFKTGWPMAVRSLWRETLVAFLLTLAGTIAAYGLVHADPSWFYTMIPDGMAQGRDPTASAQMLRDTIYQAEKEPGMNDSMLATFAVFLFTHNSQVCIFSFALGFAFAVPTVLLITYNGMMLGAMVAVFADKGLGVGFAGWIAIHGTTELFAIVLAGAAGIHIGTAVAFPGREARMESAVRAGRRAAVVMAGVVCMLLLAGLLEGIGRQTIQSDALRFAIGGMMLTGWLVYFYGFARKRGLSAKPAGEGRGDALAAAP
jgi:uncharacterized membrane protein SpoIIM required for sporulation